MATTDSGSNTGQTMLELTQLDDGRWRATQAGVEIGGYGETGALTARDLASKKITG